MNTEKFSISCTPSADRINGQQVFLITASNGTIKINFTNYGCILISLLAPDKNGVQGNVVSGFEKPEDYLNSHPFFGSIVGRYANRIEYGKFTLHGEHYQLPVNNKTNHLHGGVSGFDKKVWTVKQLICDEQKAGAIFTYTSPHLEEGYPGNLHCEVTYLLTANNELQLNYKATCDRSTIVNLTNHSYFNLSGFASDTVYDHYLLVNAESYTPKNDNNVPSGEIWPVENTPLDFRKATRIGDVIDEMVTDKGYDHNFVFPTLGSDIVHAATLKNPGSGRVLDVFTNQPGMQVYTANWWDGSITGAQGKPYQQHGAIALETQNFPDAPNHENFPSAVLLPGELYDTTTIYRLSVTS